MRIPFFSPKADSPLHLPLPQRVEMTYLVFCRPASEALLAPIAMQAAAIGLNGVQMPEPLRGGLHDYLASDLLSLQTRPAMPPQMIDLCVSGGWVPEAQEKAMRQATHLIVIKSQDLLRYPRYGFWGAYVAARALSRLMDGVALDVDRNRAFTFDTEIADMQAMGIPHLRYFLNIPQSVDERGLGWMTTEGMRAFGLPEMQIKDVPPAVMPALTQMLCGVCQQLMMAVMRLFDGGTPSTTVFTVGPTMSLSLEDISLAWGEAITAYAPDAKESVVLRLAMERGHPPVKQEFLTLLPPRGFSGSHGEWLHSLVTDLIGHEQTGYGVPTGDDAMLAAHERAMAELPRVKQRFQTGLAVGERLAVKHGFPMIEEGKREYMWVMVNTWAGAAVQGQLANEPNFRRDLKPGQMVELPEADIYDWLLYLPDGTQEGGYTNLAERP